MMKSVKRMMLLGLLVMLMLLGAKVDTADAAISSVVINYYPLHIPIGDGANPANCVTGGTPFAVRVTVNTTTPNENFAAKVRLGTAGCTWNPITSTWTNDSTAFTSLPRGTTDGAGTATFWLYGRATSSATTSLTVRVRACDATFTTCPTPNADSTAATVSLMNMSTTGGWLEESTGTSRQGRTVAVFNSSNQLVGLYVAENNGVNEGYSSTPGYFRVAVPECTDCGYRIETWALNAPGTAVGQINTMGQNGCNNNIAAGAIVSLNGCSVPTAVTLTQQNSQTPTSPSSALWLLVGVLGLSTAVVFANRRRAL
jgi:hypothetical protein